MARVIPFRGVLYNDAIVGNARDVVAPPYDIVDAETQRTLYSRHPYNVIRLELGLDQPEDSPSDNRYTRAAQYLQDWLRRGALALDPKPAIYPYTIEYRVPHRKDGDVQRVLKGFLSLMALEEFGPGRVLPHENTRAAAKTDRLNLLETCRANFSPIFSLFSDPDRRVSSMIERATSLHKPRIEFVDDDGFRQQLWAITDSGVHEELIAAMQPKSLFIADGHHRYETALTYRDMQRKKAGARLPVGTQPWDAVLMLCASLEDPGLTVLPTHRVLKLPLPPITDIQEKLGDQFDIQEIGLGSGNESEARTRFLRLLRERGCEGKVFGLALKGTPSYFLLTLRAERDWHTAESPRDQLDVSVLHTHIFRALSLGELTEETVWYTKDDEEALDLVRSGKADGAFLLNPTRVSEVSAVASAGERMPHKSTYFFPKPLTGLVMHVMGGDLDEDHGARR